MVSEASRDASRTRPCLMCSCPSPAMPMASDDLSPAAVQSSRSSSKRPPEMSAWTRKALPHSQGASGDAHRSAARIVGGQRVGDLARPLPTGPRRHNVAGGRPRSGAHVPAVGGVQITGGLQMFGDQGGILVSRCRVT